jgi:hypothetical protein
MLREVAVGVPALLFVFCSARTLCTPLCSTLCSQPFNQPRGRVFSRGGMEEFRSEFSSWSPLPTPSSFFFFFLAEGLWQPSFRSSGVTFDLVPRGIVLF